MITAITQCTIVVRDYDEAINFYVRTLGLTLLEDTDLGQGKRWVRVGPGTHSGASLLLARAANDRQSARVGDQTGGRVALFMHTDHCRDDVARLKSLGVTFKGEPRDEPYGTVVVLEDLYGNLIDLIQPPRSASAPSPAPMPSPDRPRVPATTSTTHTIERLDPAGVTEQDVSALAALLVDAVDSGAAVSFLSPLSHDRALAWWRSTLASAHADPKRGIILLAARDPDSREIIATVQAHPAWAPNQPHRAEVCKLIVHRSARGHGLARALMHAIERESLAAGFTLLTLDARKGGPAERLYHAVGWTRVGEIPRFALDNDARNHHATVIFYKDLT